MNTPEHLRFTKSHEWVRLDGARVVFGLTDFAQSQLGDIVFLEPPAVNAALERGEPCGSIESTKAVSDLFAPLSGRVVAVNEALGDGPDTINRDPYEQGWIAIIEPSEPGELASLLDAAAYVAFVEHAD
jgi:glycine cleavage system H protein